MGWTTGVRFPAGAGNLSPRHRVQSGSGTHLASFSGSKAVGAQSWPVTSI